MKHTARFSTYKDAMDFVEWITARQYDVLSVKDSADGHYALMLYLVTYVENFPNLVTYVENFPTI